MDNINTMLEVKTAFSERRSSLIESIGEWSDMPQRIRTISDTAGRVMLCGAHYVPTRYETSRSCTSAGMYTTVYLPQGIPETQESIDRYGQPAADILSHGGTLSEPPTYS